MPTRSVHGHKVSGFTAGGSSQEQEEVIPPEPVGWDQALSFNSKVTQYGSP